MCCPVEQVHGSSVDSEWELEVGDDVVSVWQNRDGSRDNAATERDTSTWCLDYRWRCSPPCRCARTGGECRESDCDHNSRTQCNDALSRSHETPSDSCSARLKLLAPVWTSCISTIYKQKTTHTRRSGLVTVRSEQREQDSLVHGAFPLTCVDVAAVHGREGLAEHRAVVPSNHRA